jgi:hypothetical protein
MGRDGRQIVQSALCPDEIMEHELQIPDDEEDLEVLATAKSLHELGLRYWADGRRVDAIRVENEAQALLLRHAVGPELLSEVNATLEELGGTGGGIGPLMA